MSNSGDRSNAGKNTATRVADDAPGARFHGGEEEEAVRWRNRGYTATSDSDFSQ